MTLYCDNVSAREQQDRLARKPQAGDPDHHDPHELSFQEKRDVFRQDFRLDPDEAPPADTTMQKMPSQTSSLDHRPSLSAFDLSPQVQLRKAEDRYAELEQKINGLQETLVQSATYGCELVSRNTELEEEAQRLIEANVEGQVCYNQLKRRLRDFKAELAFDREGRWSESMESTHSRASVGPSLASGASGRLEDTGRPPPQSEQEKKRIMAWSKSTHFGKLGSTYFPDEMESTKSMKSRFTGAAKKVRIRKDFFKNFSSMASKSEDWNRCALLRKETEDLENDTMMLKLRSSFRDYEDEDMGPGVDDCAAQKRKENSEQNEPSKWKTLERKIMNISLALGNTKRRVEQDKLRRELSAGHERVYIHTEEVQDLRKFQEESESVRAKELEDAENAVKDLQTSRKDASKKLAQEKERLTTAQEEYAEHKSTKEMLQEELYNLEETWEDEAMEKAQALFVGTNSLRDTGFGDVIDDMLTQGGDDRQVDVAAPRASWNTTMIKASTDEVTMRMQVLKDELVRSELEGQLYEEAIETARGHPESEIAMLLARREEEATELRHREAAARVLESKESLRCHMFGKELRQTLQAVSRMTKRLYPDAEKDAVQEQQAAQYYRVR